MTQKNMFILAAIISILLFSACNQLEKPKMPKELVKKISAKSGELALKYENGHATLSGTLQRSTPCVNWTVKISSTKDLPISRVNIDVFDSNKGAICIQVLGEPHEINETISRVSEKTEYAITFEETPVFSGKLEQ